MSRPDSHEFEYPPGLGAYRTRFQEPTKPQDRRPSNGVGAFGNTGSRSMGVQPSNYALPDVSGTNRHNPTPSLSHFLVSSPYPPFTSSSHHHPSPPLAHSSASPTDRDVLFLRQPQASGPHHNTILNSGLNSAGNTNTNASRSTLWWGDLEPWMDEEYAKQVCGLMGWDPTSIKVPHPPPDPSTGQQANNPGYCFLTFPSPSQAASVLAQISNAGRGTLTMPNSIKPFVLNWASSVNSTSPLPATFQAPAPPQPTHNQQYPKEYSIFVGDLAPETSNSDLVAVFRNPVLGLRNDREPKFIRPFPSCKSAKIMLDPVTGVSRGYGFVRFTDEADQQRALIEMHGLYCLSRPMRISPATAKFKAPPALAASFDLPQVQFTPPVVSPGHGDQNQPITIALPLPASTQAKSVSAPIAASSNIPGSGSGSSIGGSQSSNSLSSGAASNTSIATSIFGSEEASNAFLQQLAHSYTGADASLMQNVGAFSGYPFEEPVRPNPPAPPQADRVLLTEDAWKHHNQARAILGNLIGPNGEQLTSTDPYNTTVFVGGLSPLISEETLRTFFAPFGDIHYVKVPVGKHCGFVQFVRKADAERAIEKMQGFPIGGSRIRLSWGRSQYKAAQAAAQAAQAAALQAQYVPASSPGAINQDQASQLLKNFNVQQYMTNPSLEHNRDLEHQLLNAGYLEGPEEPAGLPTYIPRSDVHRTQLNFSPFSPDPTQIYASSDSLKRESSPFSSALPHPSKAYTPGFYSVPQDLKLNTSLAPRGKVSPTHSNNNPASASRYSFAESSDPSTPINRAPGRHEQPISRPSSGQIATTGRISDDSDPIHDLNGTLASLDLDHPWRSPDAGGKEPGSG